MRTGEHRQIHAAGELRQSEPGLHRETAAVLALDRRREALLAVRLHELDGDRRLGVLLQARRRRRHPRPLS